MNNSANFHQNRPRHSKVIVNQTYRQIKGKLVELKDKTPFVRWNVSLHGNFTFTYLLSVNLESYDERNGSSERIFILWSSCILWIPNIWTLCKSFWLMNDGHFWTFLYLHYWQGVFSYGKNLMHSVQRYR